MRCVMSAKLFCFAGAAVAYCLLLEGVQYDSADGTLSFAFSFFFQGALLCFDLLWCLGVLLGWGKVAEIGVFRVVQIVHCPVFCVVSFVFKSLGVCYVTWLAGDIDALCQHR